MNVTDVVFYKVCIVGIYLKFSLAGRSKPQDDRHRIV